MKNEPYRVDRMLQAAAQRGVRINIIVYKEVRSLFVASFKPVLTVSR
jgi:phospholipase D1/2